MDGPIENLSQHKSRKNVAINKTSSLLSEGLQDITECSICTETYNDPRILPCIHSFCLRCLEQVEAIRDRKHGDLFQCPLCRKEFRVPSSGLSSLPKNFFIARLLNILQVAELSEGNIKCDHCELMGDELMGQETIYCVQCKKNFCEECYGKHMQCGLPKDHPMSSNLFYGVKGTMQKHSEIQFCKQHVANQLEFYCLECKKVICTNCCTESHKSHNTDHVCKVSNQFTQEILGYTDDINSFLKRFNTRKQHMDEEKMEFLRELENTEELIRKRSKKLTDLIEEHTKTLLAELTAIGATQLKEFETGNDELDRHLIEAESLKTYCNEIGNTHSPVAVCYTVDDVRSRVDKMLKLSQSEILQRNQVLKVSLINSEVEDFSKAKYKNFIGKVEVRQVEKVNDTLVPRAPVQSRISVQFTAKLGIEYRRVFGVTTVQNCIYVLCQLPNGILVYDSEVPYVLKKEITMKMIRRPFDISSSLKSGSVYVVDEDNNIWKLNVKDFKMITWLRCTGTPNKLSVSRQGNILLVNSDCSLSLYTENAKLISRISLPPDILQPVHACETSVGNFVVCYKDGESLGICELDRNGMVLHSSPSKEGLQIDGPIHLVLDSDDRAFVADFSNSRVLLFDWNFLKFRILLTEEEDDIFRPLGICYDENKQQLMVAHGAGLEGATQVFIFNSISIPD